MGHGHSHSHAPVGASAAYRKRLVVVLVLTLVVMVVQVVGSLAADSLALLADAGHMLGDSAGLMIALAAMQIANRPTGTLSRNSFGHHRVEILAAALNAGLLLVLAGFIVVRAVMRVGDGAEVDGTLMFWVGLVGLTVNVFALWLLAKGASESLNVRGAYLEVLGDALGSIAVIVAAVVIATTGWAHADTLASLLIAVLIVPRALSLLRDAVDVLLEATPRGVELEALRTHLLEVPGVIDVHDLHVWTITSGMPVMSAHVVVEDEVISDCNGAAVLDRLGECLSDHFDVAHSTFQLEPPGHVDHEGHVHP